VFDERRRRRRRRLRLRLRPVLLLELAVAVALAGYVAWKAIASVLLGVGFELSRTMLPRPGEVTVSPS
jgi:hypothetical protein